MSKEAKSTEKAENGNVFIADIRCSATIGNTLNKQTSTDTTICSGGWVTDNFETYYLD